MTGEKLMKITSTLAASLSLLFLTSGCAIKAFPSFPDIKHHYAIDIVGEEMNPVLQKWIVNIDDLYQVQLMSTAPLVSCLDLEIVSTNPYQLKYVGVVKLQQCNGVGGYKPDDSVKFYNFIEDIYKWAEGRKKCFYDEPK